MIVGICFFKQKTAYEMRISDWSSVVCSSDLGQAQPRRGRRFRPAGRRRLRVLGIGRPKLPKALSYEESRELAHNGSDRARADLAVRIDLRPEVLYFLAEDPPTEVRRRIAAKAKRSEERRVGKERVITCRSGWSPSHSKKNYTRDISNQV